MNWPPETCKRLGQSTIRLLPAAARCGERDRHRARASPRLSHLHLQAHGPHVVFQIRRHPSALRAKAFEMLSYWRIQPGPLASGAVGQAQADQRRDRLDRLRVRESCSATLVECVGVRIVEVVPQAHDAVAGDLLQSRPRRSRALADRAPWQSGPPRKAPGPGSAPARTRRRSS